MAVVYGTERQPIGKVKPTKDGACAAFVKRHRLGLFVNESMAIAAVLDCADTPLEPEPWWQWVEALLTEEDD